MFFISLFSMFVQLKQSTLKPGLVLCLRSIQKRNGLNVATKILFRFSSSNKQTKQLGTRTLPLHTHKHKNKGHSVKFVSFSFISFITQNIPEFVVVIGSSKKHLKITPQIRRKVVARLRLTCVKNKRILIFPAMIFTRAPLFLVFRLLRRNKHTDLKEVTFAILEI